MTDAGEMQVTRADAEGLARKLEAMTGELSEQELAVLGLILARATASEPDVEGFAFEAYLHVKGTKQGQLKGETTGGVTAAAGFGLGMDVITVRKAGGTQPEF
jgi:hypothetical protein